MKSIILNSVVLLISCFSFCQTAIKSGMDSGGATATVGNLQVLYTIGEVHVKEANVAPLMISEGFINKGDLEIYSEFVLVPDSQFEQALIDQGIDSDGTINGQVPRTDVQGVTILNISGYDITSFEGIDSFTSLLTFNHINNQAAAINPIDFSGNLALQQIDIINAPNLAQIEISQNAFLQSLTVVTNNTLFNAIDVTNNFDLETLVLSSNGLTTLNIDNNPLLTLLSVGDNPITSLDVSSLGQLETFNLYETQIEILDVSNLVNLVTVSAYNGSLKAANFQNGGGNTDNVQFVDVSGNPDLECILVDSIAWAENPSGWIKDATASYIENLSLNFTTFPGSLIVQSDGAGNQIEFNAWLADNGGAVVTAECGSVIWTYEILTATATSEEFESSIEYLVEFSASTPYNEPDITQASFTIENITGAGEDDGSGGDLCSAVSYDLSNLITVDLNAPNIDSFRFEQIDVFPATPGVPDATFNGTEVDFPDTGAGSFSYTFRLIVEKSIDVYNTATGTYESILFTDESRLTVNNVKIPFNPGPDQEKAWCPGATLPTLTELYEEFEIIDGVEFEGFDLTFTPENYWFDANGIPITEVTGPGDYIFNANGFLPECGAIPATVTVVAGKSAGISTSFEICPSSSLTEQDLIAALGADAGGTWVPSIVDPDNVDAGTYTYSHGACTIGQDSTVTISFEQELFAGNDVFDAEDQTSYRCGDTVSFDLNTFRDASADPGGNWFDDSNNLVPNGITDFPDTGAGSFTRSFSYKQANDVCGFQSSEAFYDVTWNAAPLSTGTSTSIEICTGSSLTEQDLLLALGGDSGGTWSPVIDINNVIGGTYIYSLGDCTFEGDTSIEVIESALSITSVAQNESSTFFSYDQPVNLDLDAFNNWLNTNGGALAASACGDITWTYSYDVSYSDAEDTVTYLTTFVATDDVSSVNTIATFTFDNVYVSAGLDFINESEAGIDGGTRCGNDDFSLSIIDGFYIPYYDTAATYEFAQTEGPPGVAFDGPIADFPDTGAGSFLYSFDFIRNLDIQFPDLFLSLSDEAIVTFWVVVPFDVGEDGTLEVCPGQEVTLMDLYNALEGTPNLEGSNFDMADLWTPSVYSGPDVYTFDFSKVAPSCSFDSSTVTVTELPTCDTELNLKVFLQGASLNPNVGEESLMRDDLRVSGSLPSTTPYEDKISCDPLVFNISGPDAIVDWVWVELRESGNNTIIVDSRSALLQRDGDVVAVDGVSPLVYSVPSANYFVSVNHRNHLGIMSSDTISFNYLPVFIDFSNASVSTFGNFAQTTDGMPTNVFGMWAGDVNGDGVIQYAGAGVLDTTALLAFILNDNTNFLNIPTWAVNTYNNYDVDMSGSTQFAGAGLLDTPFILQNILSYQGNFLGLNTWQIVEQLPNNQ